MNDIQSLYKYVLQDKIQEIDVISKPCTRKYYVLQDNIQEIDVISKPCTRKYYVLQDNIQDNM